MSVVEAPPAGIEVVGVHKSFGAAHVLRGVDVSVPAGGVLAVLGPSGCGKTTLLRAIAGFATIDAGTIRLGARLLAGPGTSLAPERRRVGIVPQEGALFPHLRVGENVGFGVGRGANRAEVVRRWLGVVGLAHAERARPHELSGGQQQRVALARALAADPEVVLLDEPFAALDAGLRAGVRAEVVRILRDAGRTAVLVTHDQQEALSTADVVAVMLDGVVVQLGRPADVYARPATLAAARVVGDTVVVDGIVTRTGVTCALGALPLARPAPEGDAVVVLRPEQLLVALEQPGTGAATRATVLDASFTGPDVVLSLAVEGAAPLSARVPGIAPPARGEHVWVQVRGPVLAYERAASRPGGSQ